MRRLPLLQPPRAHSRAIAANGTSRNGGIATPARAVPSKCRTPAEWLHLARLRLSRLLFLRRLRLPGFVLRHMRPERLGPSAEVIIHFLQFLRRQFRGHLTDPAGLFRRGLIAPLLHRAISLSWFRGLFGRCFFGRCLFGGCLFRGRFFRSRFFVSHDDAS